MEKENGTDIPTAFRMKKDERACIDEFCKLMGYKLGEFARQAMFEKIARTDQDLINVRRAMQGGK